MSYIMKYLKLYVNLEMQRVNIMQKISTEFRKGILFIRIKGRFNNESFKKTTNYLINNIGIKIIVLNISNLEYFSLEDIEHIINYKKQILKKKRKLIICDNKTTDELFFFKEIPRINKEIDAFSLI